MTAALTDSVTQTGVALQIPCECRDVEDCQHGGDGCSHPASLWVIAHDFMDNCRAREDGVLSLFMCQNCWEIYSAFVDEAVKWAVSGAARSSSCSACGLEIRRRTDVIHRVQAIGGTQ